MSEAELLELLMAAKNQDEYDMLVDRYVFKIDKEHRNIKKNRKHNMLTCNQMLQIQRKEKPYDFTRPGCL
ncbi:MAG: hypothetical protein ACRC8T_05765 [Acidaminococcaceae bacterium]